MSVSEGIVADAEAIVYLNVNSFKFSHVSNHNYYFAHATTSGLVRHLSSAT